jgi:hypothetical protein
LRAIFWHLVYGILLLAAALPLLVLLTNGLLAGTLPGPAVRIMCVCGLLWIVFGVGFIVALLWSTIDLGARSRAERIGDERSEFSLKIHDTHPSKS